MRRLLAVIASTLIAVDLVAMAPTTAQAKTTKPTPIGVAPATPTQGQPFTISGKIGTKVKRPVTAQYKTGSSWKTLVSGKTTSKGAYTLTTTTSATSLAVRVVAKKVKIKHKTYKKVTTKTRTINLATPPATTRLVSVSSNGAMANDSADDASISADGRYVAFHSLADNLVPNDIGGHGDVFLTDVNAGATTLISASLSGTPANGESWFPRLSADARYVAFTSRATNLTTTTVAAGTRNVFVRDRSTGITSLVSLATDGTPGNSDSDLNAISPDGRFIVFESSAANLVAGDTNAAIDVFVRDRSLNTTTRVSVPTGSSGQGSEMSSQGVISPDGTKVVFCSSASNLVAGDVNHAQDIFVRDLTTHLTSLVSRSSAGTLANDFSIRGNLSPDGRYVLFESAADNLVPNDNNGLADQFVRDLTTGTTTRINLDSFGNEANAVPSGVTLHAPVMSADHRYVSFGSLASNLVGDDTVDDDVFLRDLATGTTTRVSLTSTGAQTPAGARFGDMTPDGRYVVMTAIGNLTGSHSSDPQVYIRGPLH